MNKWKKVVGNVMVASMILTNTSAISVAAKETEAEKQYVILAENDQNCRKMQKKRHWKVTQVWLLLH